jgi:hypothetical protein
MNAPESVEGEEMVQQDDPGEAEEAADTPT